MNLLVPIQASAFNALITFLIADIDSILHVGDFSDISTADPDEANQAVREFLDGKHIELPDSTENPKASFGVSPTASLVLKYFIPTFATSGIYLVFKVGAEQSRGVARIQSIEKDENFRQMSTLISFGFERPFGEFFWSLMITRRMSRTIKLSPMIDILGNSINPRLKLSDTRLEMSLIKRL
jgi:hypothetical protein